MKRPSKSVKNLMSSPLVTVASGSSLTAACAVMEQKKIRHLPVADEKNNIIGIVSKRDLRMIKDPQLIPVDHVMSSPVASIDENTPLRSAISKFFELKISSLLVTGDNGGFVGIITSSDLLWYLSHILEKHKKEMFSMTSLLDLQTVGEVLRQMALIGI